MFSNKEDRMGLETSCVKKILWRDSGCCHHLREKKIIIFSQNRQKKKYPCFLGSLVHNFIKYWHQTWTNFGALLSAKSIFTPSTLPFRWFFSFLQLWSNTKSLWWMWSTHLFLPLALKLQYLQYLQFDFREWQ